MKKTSCVMLVIIFCMTLCIPAAAYEGSSENADSSIVNTVVALSDSVPANVVASFETATLAYTTNEAGESIPVPATVTIKELPALRSGSGMQEGKTYSATVTASVQKQESNSESANNDSYSVSADLTMVWTDVPGIDNTIDRLYGEANVLRGTYKTGIVNWGGSCNGYGQKKQEVASYFDFDLSTPFENGQLHAHYKVWLEEKENVHVLMVCVQPTIFD